MNNEMDARLEAILRSAGQVTAYNVIRLKVVYEDKKLRITALFNEDRPAYESLFVELKIPPKGLEPGNFGLPRSESATSETLVYLNGRLFAHYLRPGRWMNYIDELEYQINLQSKILARLNGEPIDDADLFSGRNK